MLTLGIETSCDETSVALVEDGRRILSNVVSSQVEVHRAYGGVVPEMAARHHLERLPRVMDLALAEAGVTLAEVDLLAVTRGPGLVGALLVGVGFARGLAAERGLPLIGVSHLDGHVHSAFLAAPDARPPALVLLVSGGHTELVLLGEDGGYQVLGRTRDDAAGEAFDKVARLLGLPYPGGPEIDRLASGVDPTSALRRFPLPPIRVDGLDFSFSGIKTAVRYALEPPASRRSTDTRATSGQQPGEPALVQAEAVRRQRPGEPAPPVPARDPALVQAAAAAFQWRAVEHLLDRLERAAREHRPATVAIAGGVARNRALREAATARLAGLGRVVVPPAALCTDNAAMIAAAGAHLWRAGRATGLEVDPGLGLTA